VAAVLESFEKVYGVDGRTAVKRADA